jgi:hypothetical protein
MGYFYIRFLIATSVWGGATTHACVITRPSCNPADELTFTLGVNNKSKPAPIIISQPFESMVDVKVSFASCFITQEFPPYQVISPPHWINNNYNKTRCKWFYLFTNLRGGSKPRLPSGWEMAARVCAWFVEKSNYKRIVAPLHGATTTILPPTSGTAWPTLPQSTVAIFVRLV